ncbi:MAG: hypothetical protein P9L94_13230 [Candidatus Hinthialibacter antarcticus]|nr:hypothetical protein [Candidatus Hinthialibacter antarcticus]
MKTYFCLPVVCLIAAVFVFSPQAQVIKAVDFSAASGYVDGPVEDQGDGDSVWITGTASNGTSRFEVVNEKLVVTQNPDDSQWIYLFMPTLQGDFSATWDWQFIRAAENVDDVSDTVDFGFTFSDSVNFELTDGNPAINFNECGMMIRMNANPISLDARDGDWAGGGTYTSVNPLDYRGGELISMRVEVNALEEIYDAYASYDGGEEIMLADDYGFRRIASEETLGVNCIAIWCNGDVHGNAVVIDDIVLYGASDVGEFSLY